MGVGFSNCLVIDQNSDNDLVLDYWTDHFRIAYPEWWYRIFHLKGGFRATLGGYQAHTEDMETHVNKGYMFFHRVLSVCDGDPFSNV